MAGYLTSHQKAKFLQSQILHHEDVITKLITWKRSLGVVDRWGEDNPEDTFEDIPLECLCNYNYMRSWPITVTSETGNLDRQSIQLLFSIPKLKAQGYLTPHGHLAYNPEADRFLIDGLVYKPNGDTSVSQLHDGSDLLYTIIVRPEELSNGQIPGNGRP